MVSQKSLKHALPPRVHWPIVGREDEVALLVHRLSSGSGGVVVMGSAGMGKSTVVAAALAQLRTSNAVVDLPAPAEASRALPYVDQWLGITTPANTAVETVVEQIKVHLGPEVVATSPIIGLDDLHLVDNFSAGVLSRLVTNGVIRLVGTAREDPGLPSAFDALWRSGQIDRTDLVPLGYESIRLILREALPGPASNDMAYKLWECTAGNPLHLRELLYSIVEAGDVTYAEHAWVWTAPLRTDRRLTDLLASDIGALSSPERDVVDLVAMAESVSLSLLAPSATDDVLRDLVERGLIVIAEYQGDQKARIGHPLYAETLRSLLYPRRRRELFEVLPEPVPGRHSARELCRWVDWALECSLMPSVPTLLAAGAAYEAFSQPSLAAPLAALALAHQQLQIPERIVALLLSARANRDAGWSESAEADLESLLALETDGHILAESVKVAMARIKADLRLLHYADFDGGLEVLATVAKQLEPGGVGAAELAVEQLSRLGFGGRHAEVLAAYGPQLAAADIPANLILAAPYIYALAQSGRAEEALELADISVKLVGPEHAEFPLLRASLMAARFWAAVWAGRPDLAVTLPDYVEDGIQRHHSALYQTGAGYICLFFGAWEQAVAELRGGLSRMGLSAPTGLEAMAWAGLAQGHAMRGERQEAIHACQQFGLLAPAMDRSVEVDSRYRILVTKLAVGAGELPQLTEDYTAWARSHGLSHGVLLGLHLQIVLASPGQRAPLMSALTDAASAVQGQLPPALMVHAQALSDGDPGAVNAAVAALCQLGIWLPVSAKSLELTRRQQEIAALVAAGLSNKSIAQKLGISVRTVDTHLSHIFARAGVNTRAELTGVLTATL